MTRVISVVTLYFAGEDVSLARLRRMH